MRSCWRARGVIMICIRRSKEEACSCRRTAEDNRIVHTFKGYTENAENPCLADFGGTWVFLGVLTSFVPERSNKKGARFAKARETVAFLLAQKSLAKNAFNNKLSSAYFRKRLYIAVKT